MSDWLNQRYACLLEYESLQSLICAHSVFAQWDVSVNTGSSIFINNTLQNGIGKHLFLSRPLGPSHSYCRSCARERSYGCEIQRGNVPEGMPGNENPKRLAADVV